MKAYITASQIYSATGNFKQVQITGIYGDVDAAKDNQGSSENISIVEIHDSFLDKLRDELIGETEFLF